MRNSNSRFSINPQINISRSKFNRDSTTKTSFNVGELIPFYFDEVLPGDTHQIKTNLLARLQPLVTAPMDNLYLDTYYFFVPNRLVWEHWKELNGENTESAWIPKTDYSVPQITTPRNGWKIGTIADYFGLPTNVEGYSVSALPFRAYSLIVNEWFRDQNLQDPLNIPKDDTTVTGSNGGNYILDTVLGGKPFVCAKYHDYFTSCLPAPQKGPDVLLSDVGGNFAPIIAGKELSPLGNPLKIGSSNLSSAVSDGSNQTLYKSLYLETGSHNSEIPKTGKAVVNTSNMNSGSVINGRGDIDYTNLGINIGSVTTINQLRMAFQIQKMYEKDARGGTRYNEMIKSHFGVTSPDARLQRPEYLGGKRISININPVVQSSSTVDDSPQGNVAAYSVTADSNGDFIQSFTEHGIIIGLAVVRYEHTYQQGINRFWSKKTRTDFYLPVLANIGEQPVLKKELFVTGNNIKNEEVFGYQEAWADYRYKPSIVTGEMRSKHGKSLDSWHFADSYNNYPSLSADWIKEDKNNVDRALAVSSNIANQIFADFYIQNQTTRPMPMYSIPGLIDHN